jgi:hypothetical protein
MPERGEKGGEIDGIKMEEAEPWEPWETKLVVWSIAIGIVFLIVGGYLINAFVLNK